MMAVWLQFGRPAVVGLAVPVYKGRGVELRIANPRKVRRNYREILTLLQRYLRAHRMANRREIIQTLEDLKGL